MVEKTDTYTTLVLFSMGITKGKWGTLMDALMDFKALHDADTPCGRSCPTWSSATPAVTAVPRCAACARRCTNTSPAPS